MDREKHVDESWKDSVAQEKEKTFPETSSPAESHPAEGANPMEVNFINYISSLVFQAMIFLGELPNPMTNEAEKNPEQAKFLIDTLVVIREKTKGNLTKPEDDLLNSAVYELQMRYVDLMTKEKPQGGR
jgi:hypothetical protein